MYIAISSLFRDSIGAIVIPGVFALRHDFCQLDFTLTLSKDNGRP